MSQLKESKADHGDWEEPVSLARLFMVYTAAVARRPDLQTSRSRQSVTHNALLSGYS